MTTTHGISEAELRRDLATAFRVIQARGLNDGLFNHCSVVLDGGHTFLINRFGLLWSEVTAENLVEFDAEGEIVSGEGPIYAGAAVTHAAVHGYAPLRNVCCLHLHPPWATALACLDPCPAAAPPLPVGETALCASSGPRRSLTTSRAPGRSGDTPGSTQSCSIPAMASQ